MGTFKDSLKKWFYTNSTSAASSDARLPFLDANGNPKGSDTLANLALAIGVRGIGYMRTIRTVGSNGGVLCLLRLANSNGCLSTVVFQCVWGFTSMYDIISINSNGISVWLVVRSLFPQHNKYYYKIVDNKIELYCHDYGSTFSLATGQFFVSSANDANEIVNASRTVSALDGATEATYLQ